MYELIAENTKWINKLNNLNQEAKNIFKRYFLYPDGKILARSDDYATKKGCHIGQTDYKFPIAEVQDKIIYLTSSQIFRVIKENKKQIKSMNIHDDGNIYLYTNDMKYSIGQVIDNDNKLLNDVISFDPNEKSICDSTSVIEETVYNLVKNDWIIISYMSYGMKVEYKTRLTRELLPGLKKTHEVYFNFGECDQDTFYTYLKVVRGKVMVTYHRYRCVKF